MSSYMSRCKVCHKRTVWEGERDDSPLKNHYMACRDYVGPLKHSVITVFWASWRDVAYCSCGKSYDYFEYGTPKVQNCPDWLKKER